MNEGWIRLKRSLIDWEWYEDANTMRVFLHCLLLANFTDKSWRGIVIKRGSFVGSVEKIANSLGLSRQQVRTSVSKLKTTKEITTKKALQGTVFIINNYDEHQSDNHPINQQSTTTSTSSSTIDQPRDNHPITTTKNDKKEKNDKNINKTLNFSCWPDQPKEQTLNDWLALRKRLKAPASQTVIDQFSKELHKAVLAGHSVDYCLAECVTRGWRGFKFEWLTNSQSGLSSGQERSTRDIGLQESLTDKTWAN